MLPWLKKLIDLKTSTNLTNIEIAKKLGKSRSSVTKALNYNEEVKKEIIRIMEQNSAEFTQKRKEIIQMAYDTVYDVLKANYEGLSDAAIAVLAKEKIYTSLSCLKGLGEFTEKRENVNKNYEIIIPEDLKE